MVSGEEDWTLVARLKAQYAGAWIAVAVTALGELKLQSMEVDSILADELESQTWDVTLASLLNNLNRIRHQIVAIAGVDWGDAEAAVLKSLYNANTILKADSGNTPIALTIPEQRLVGRITGGVITALTVAQVKTMLDLKLSDITIDTDLVMGAHNITLAAGQTVDGKDVSTLGIGDMTKAVYDTNDSGKADMNMVIEPSEFLIASADNEALTDNATYTKKKEVTLYNAGTYRIKFSIVTLGGESYVRIFKNGVAYGTERQTTTSWVVHTEDLAFAAGDLVQLYLKKVSGNACRAKNFRVYGNMHLIPSVEINLD